MTLVQTNYGDRSLDPPLYVDMKFALHYTPVGQKLPGSYVICTKAADHSGPSKYVAHIYLHDRPVDREVTSMELYSVLRDALIDSEDRAHWNADD